MKGKKMTREEAHKNIELLKLEDNFLDACDIGNLHLLINEIFDNFENINLHKVCFGCKHQQSIEKYGDFSPCYGCSRNYADKWNKR